MAAKPESQKRVLIIEDFSALRLALRDVLNLEGFSVEHVANGKEAVEHLEKNGAPDAVIVDYRLPVMGGADFLAWLKGDPRFQSVFAIATSAASNESHCKGADFFMKKPLDTNALIQLLHDRCGPR
jgi:CheY-like chemotaxis protein